MGTGSQLHGAQSGIIPRLVRGLFRALENVSDATVEASVLEVYGEELRDLLSQRSDPLQIRETLSGAIHIAGLTRVRVHSPDILTDVLSHGAPGRQTHATRIPRFWAG
jgi:Kinesin motor domain